MLYFSNRRWEEFVSTYTVNYTIQACEIEIYLQEEKSAENFSSGVYSYTQCSVYFKCNFASIIDRVVNSLWTTFIDKAIKIKITGRKIIYM